MRTANLTAILQTTRKLANIIIIIIIIKLPDQAIASTPSAPRPPREAGQHVESETQTTANSARQT
jgi:hypothetical protein